MEFWPDIGAFFLKALIIVIAIVAIIGAIARAVGSGDKQERGRLVIRKLNDHFARMELKLKQQVLPKRVFKRAAKAKKIEDRARRKALAAADAADAPHEPRVYVLEFNGNVRAGQVKSLRHEVTAVLSVAVPGDEVVVKLRSPGGLVHAYGLAASQLERIKARGVTLTVAVDMVAASGGYLMACVADRILAAPFAIVGSIGVVAGLPNFHRWMKKNDIDFELITAGEYKRTLTMFGENTDKGRQKFQQDMDETHALFKGFVSRYRQGLDLATVATGEHWYASQAIELGLVDELKTSDDYLMTRQKEAQLFSVKHKLKRSLFDRTSAGIQQAVERAFERLWQSSEEKRFL